MHFTLFPLTACDLHGFQRSVTGTERLSCSLTDRRTPVGQLRVLSSACAAASASIRRGAPPARAPWPGALRAAAPRGAQRAHGECCPTGQAVNTQVMKPCEGPLKQCSAALLTAACSVLSNEVKLFPASVYAPVALPEVGRSCLQLY